MTINDFFGYLGIFLIIVNACLFIWSYRRFKTTIALKYFSIYIVIICLIQVISFTHYLLKINNLYLSHFYFISQFILLSLFYKALFKKWQQKLIDCILFIVLSALTIQYIIKPELYYKFNVLEIFITTFPIVIYSIMHLYNSLNKQGKFMLINSGVLMYLTTSTLIYILGNYIASNTKNNIITNIWFFNKILNVGYLILISLEWKKSYLQLRSR